MISVLMKTCQSGNIFLESELKFSTSPVSGLTFRSHALEARARNGSVSEASPTRFARRLVLAAARACNLNVSLLAEYFRP